MFSAVTRSLIKLVQVLIACRTIFAWATIVIHLALASIASLVFLVHRGVSIAVEFLMVEDKGNNDGNVRACEEADEDSPDNMDSAITDPASDSWVDLTDIDGNLLDASFRWKYKHFDQHHVQGPLQSSPEIWLDNSLSGNLQRLQVPGY
jgi:hypothetical protein